MTGSRRGALLLPGLALALCGCDPFEAMTTEVDQRVADADAGKIQLLSSEHRLPPSATKVRLYFLHFQDSVLRVRFEAPTADAVRFAETYIGEPLQEGCEGFQLGADKLDWWSSRCPRGARHAEQYFSDDPPARFVLLIADAGRATVWIDTHED